MRKIRYITGCIEGAESYESALQYFLQSVKHWKLPYHMFVWDKDYTASKVKPVQILEAMKLYPDEDLVWLDPQALILRVPTILYHIPEYCHLGAHYLLGDEHYGPAKIEKAFMVDGTGYFKNCDLTKEVIGQWISKIELSEDHPRLLLADTIQEWIKDNDTFNLFMIPRECCYIPAQSNGEMPYKRLANPMIQHMRMI